MPWELIADRPGYAALREYDPEPMTPQDVRVQSLFSSTKHGTEMRIFRADSADTSDTWDADLRLHMPGRSAVEQQFPMHLGERFVGTVAAVGSAVEGLDVGDRVYGGGQIRDVHTADASHFWPVAGDVPAENLVYDEAAMYALGAVRDGHVRVGDRVAVFGLGAIGLMAIQLARCAGASWIVASDPIERRRRAAAPHVDAVLDPTQEDAGIAIKRMTGKLGVDVALETSGSYRALNDALRSTRYLGTTVSSAYYTGEARGLILSGEWHRNQLTIVTSRAAGPPAPRDFSWDGRLLEEARRLLHDQTLDCRDLIDPIVPMSQAAETYMDCNENPHHAIKLGIDHTMTSA